MIQIHGLCDTSAMSYTISDKNTDLAHKNFPLPIKKVLISLSLFD